VPAGVRAAAGQPRAAGPSSRPRGLAAQDLGSLPVKACYVAPGGSPSMRTRGEVDVPQSGGAPLWERPTTDAELNRDLVRLLKKPTKRPEG
jgi:hypothetical protein